MADWKNELERLLPPARIKTRLIDLVSIAADAGFYYLVPKAIVQPVDEKEISALFGFSHRHRLPLVFRAAGTSVSGQSITDGILVDLSRYWKKLLIESGGRLVRVQPGITGGLVNLYLKDHQRKIGPGPASIDAAMMGGILSNNSGGMCCGVSMNAYHTVRYIRFILPNGKAYSTENSADYERFDGECGSIALEILSIRKEILDTPVLLDRIRHKYRTKNTMGYSLNAFVDYDNPMDILAHLLIGAEGTLAFIAEVVLETVPVYPFISTALLCFPSIREACSAILPLKEGGARVVELMDRAALRSVEQQEGMPVFVQNLPDKATALLIEFQETSEEELAARLNDFNHYAGDFRLVHQPVFTSNPAEQDLLWKIRKGLYPAAGAVRASGTTVVLEDIAFPVDRLGDGVTDLQALFAKFRYHQAIIFGHAKDGNLHFCFPLSLEQKEAIERYDNFLRELVELVVKKYDGALKAEHGTGRNMAPFVETEWGSEAYQIMKRLKKAIDPTGLLNPGVILNEDAGAHLRNLKRMPTVDHEVDKCVECGFCEIKCPSRNITLTPRRRIIVRRVLKQLEEIGSRKEYKLLLRQYQYHGLDTCAVDGMCATACPVGINTGEMVKRLRRENHTVLANNIALLAARNFAFIHAMVRLILLAGTVVNTVLGKHAMHRLTKVLRKIVPALPLWSLHLPLPPDLRILKAIKRTTNREALHTIVYFPSCISRTMGTYPQQKKNILETFISICAKTRIAVIIPEKIHGSCCSQIFSSKGYSAACQFMAHQTIDQLWLASMEGAVPVVTDVSSCAYTLHQMGNLVDEVHRQKLSRLQMLDSVDFLHGYVLPRTVIKNPQKDIVLHLVCSLFKMKTEHKLIEVARHFARTVTVPKNTGCCGMAGDRGFLFPELTASAALPEAAEVQLSNYDGYYSATRTCEMAMTEAVQKNYESILYLADEMMV